MDITIEGGNSLLGLQAINVLLGKNGCGKSTILRDIENRLGSTPLQGTVRYITPERGGSLVYAPHVENQVTSDPNFLRNARRQNQLGEFKQQTVSQYRTLESIVARELEGWVKGLKDGDQNISKDREDKLFGAYIEQLNFLLENIQILRAPGSFKVFKKGTDQEIPPGNISSGESELIALGIECLSFAKQCLSGGQNLLLLDEPDVHLHPDLQARLMKMLTGLVANHDFTLLIATHSTAILGALSDKSDVGVAFMGFGQTKIAFKPLDDVHKKVIPAFGAHPLSNVFNQAPIFLVEGEDDERLWQQAVRSAKGKLAIYPCPVGSKENLDAFEQKTRDILNAVYDNAKGYSLRDRDEGPYEINDVLPVARFRLACRASENLILSDEVLESLGTTWGILEAKICEWLDKNPGHQHYQQMKAFKDAGLPRMGFDLKDLRNDIIGIIGASKAWEVAVGQVVGKLFSKQLVPREAEHSIVSYLGPKLVDALLSH